MLTQHCSTAVVSAGGIQQLGHAQSQLDVNETTESLPTSLLPWAFLPFLYLRLLSSICVTFYKSELKLCIKLAHMGAPPALSSNITLGLCRVMLCIPFFADCCSTL